MAKYDLSGSITATNLAKAFAGESQARTRYLFYAEIAKKEGMESIEQVFLETADNERGHAEIFFEYLSEGLPSGTLEPKALVPTGMAKTSNNLLYASKGEHEEWTELYPKFAEDAKKEGFTEIYTSFSEIIAIEYRHEKRFLNLLDRLKNNMLYNLPYEVIWECTNCGLRIKDNAAPEICPACHHEMGYFKIASREIYPIKR